MRAVLHIILVTFPFFALVLCGYLAARRSLLPVSAIGGLNTFVLYFALPCMLYRFGASTPVAQLFDASLLLVYLMSALTMVTMTMVLTLHRGAQKIGWNDAAFGALVAAFPNTGFMGMPLLVALLGAPAAGPVIVTLMVDMLVTSSLCIALSRLDGAGQRGAGRQAARRALQGVLANPLPWSIALGALASALNFVLPAPLMGTVSLLADAASPVALFTIGAVLARSQINSTSRTPLAAYVPITLLKLVIHPLLVGGIGLAAVAVGLPLSRFGLTVIVLVAALPSASNAAMLAERFGADSARIAHIILLSTVLAFFSFPAAVAWLT